MEARWRPPTRPASGEREPGEARDFPAEIPTDAGPCAVRVGQHGPWIPGHGPTHLYSPATLTMSLFLSIAAAVTALLTAEPRCAPPATDVVCSSRAIEPAETRTTCTWTCQIPGRVA